MADVTFEAEGSWWRRSFAARRRLRPEPRYSNQSVCARLVDSWSLILDRGSVSLFVVREAFIHAKKRVYGNSVWSGLKLEVFAPAISH